MNLCQYLPKFRHVFNHPWMCYIQYNAVTEIPLRRIRRGTKAGRNYFRPIRTVLTNSRDICYNDTKVNSNNLIQLVDQQTNSVATQQINTIINPRQSIPSKIKSMADHTNIINIHRSPLKMIPLMQTDVNTIKDSKPKSNMNMKLSVLNCRSVKNKSLSINDFVVSNDIDILAITETWLGSTVDGSVMKELVPSGYKILYKSRNDRRGGGIALLFKTNIDVKQFPPSENNFTHFEHMEFSIYSTGLRFRLCVIYRPPPSKSNGFRIATFFEEWDRYLDEHTILPHETLITGDFNFHLDNPSDPDALHFLQTLENRHLVQHVNDATHDRGHILDLVITKKCSKLLSEVPVVSKPIVTNAKGHVLLDHFAVHTSLACVKPKAEYREMSFRKLKSVCTSELKEDISETFQSFEYNITVDALLDQYQCCLSSIIDKHAPLQTKTVIVRPNTQWYSDQLRTAKREKRQAERKWRSSKLEVHRDIFYDRCKIASKLLYETKETYYSSKIESIGNDSKQLFRITKDLMGKQQKSPLPSSSSEIDLSNSFADFFINKVETIRDDLRSANQVHDNDDNGYLDHDIEFNGSALLEFNHTTDEEIRNILRKSASKSCELDPIPTNLLKACTDAVVPVVTQIVNASFDESKVPLDFKQALVRPLLKKPGLDTETFKNYRPVSNLPFLSKILEKVVAKRLDNHLDANELLDPLQSAYRAQHSTETALTRVQHDITTALDNHSSAVLVLLDLSAAFDVIDHTILLKRLSFAYGINGATLQWIRSYLTDRYQSVVIGNSNSKKCHLTFGVPQGSVLGPKLYCLFSKPIGTICRRYGFDFHCYADDTQVYMVIKPKEDWSDHFKRLENCLSNISSWMCRNMLKLNEDKTELIIFSPKHLNCHIPDLKLKVGNSIISSVPIVKNLGVYFDSHLTNEKQVSAIIRSCHFHICNIGRIRRFITTSACKTLVNALVTSRLDYGNTLLFGINKSTLNKLQKIQNTAARLVTGTKGREHISPILADLHWLPVEFRIQFKILVYVYNAIKGDAPSYIQELIQVNIPTRPLRSSSSQRLVVPKVRTKTYGHRQFDWAASHLWNNLPDSLRQCKCLSSFKTQLKTHFYRNAFT